MTRSLRLASLCSGLLLLPLSALAGPDEPYADEPDEAVVADSGWDGDQDEAEPYEAPATVAQPVAPAATPPGEWVDTQQYGRIWMPYSDAFTSVPPDGSGEPYEYVYAPAYGWTWVAAPWVWGWGPWPTFGFYGPRHFGWYGHGWWRTPDRWRYTPGARFGGSFRGGWQGSHRGAWAAPFRGPGPVRSFASPRFQGGAPAHRGFVSPGGGGHFGGGRASSGGGHSGGSSGGRSGGHSSGHFGGHGR